MLLLVCEPIEGYVGLLGGEDKPEPVLGGGVLARRGTFLEEDDVGVWGLEFEGVRELWTMSKQRVACCKARIGVQGVEF